MTWTIRHPRACVVTSMRYHVAHIQQHRSTGRTPLAVFLNGQKWSSVRSTEIIATLHASVNISGAEVGFAPEDLSARSMRVGGEISLLLVVMDTDIIQLVGSWCSESMLHCLRTMAQIFKSSIMLCMVQHGFYMPIPPVHGG